MERVNQILKLDLYKEYVNRNMLAEKQRQFCKHDMGHFLNVARIAMILNLREQYGLSEEMIYAAALLHDIGRWKQYEDGTPHEKVSAQLAHEVLIKCGFNKEETAAVENAISNHRNACIKEDKDLAGLLYRADKLSRACFFCAAENECDWKKDKKNLLLNV